MALALLLGGAAVFVLAADGDGSATCAVIAGLDDGQEATSGGAVTLNGTTLSLGKGKRLGFRFTNVSIPSNATILSAKLRLYVTGNGSASASVTFRGEFNSSAPPFTTTAYDMSSRSLTAANVNLMPPAWPNNAWAESPDLTAILQEIVDGTSWTAGGALALFIIDNGSTGNRNIAAFENSTHKPAELVVSWTTGAPTQTPPPPTPSPNPTAGPTPTPPPSPSPTPTAPPSPTVSPTPPPPTPSPSPTASPPPAPTSPPGVAYQVCHWRMYVKIRKPNGSTTSVNVPKRSTDTPVGEMIREDHVASFPVNQQRNQAFIQALDAASAPPAPGDSYERFCDAAEMYCQNHPADYPDFAELVEVKWAKRVTPVEQTTGIALELEGIPPGLEQRGLVLSRGGFTFGRVKVLGGAVYPEAGITVSVIPDGTSFGGGEVRLYADQSLEVSSLDKDFAAGATSVVAHADPAMPGESLPVQVLAGPTETGWLTLRAEHSGYTSEIRVFVSADGVELDVPFINRGELGGEVTVIAHITGETDAIFTGASADNALSCIGDDLGVRLTWIGEDKRVMALAYTMDELTRLGWRSPSFETRRRHDPPDDGLGGRQVKTYTVASRPQFLLSVDLDTDSDNTGELGPPHYAPEERQEMNSLLVPVGTAGAGAIRPMEPEWTPPGTLTLHRKEGSRCIRVWRAGLSEILLDTDADGCPLDFRAEAQDNAPAGVILRFEATTAGEDVLELRYQPIGEARVGGGGDLVTAGGGGGQPKDSVLIIIWFVRDGQGQGDPAGGLGAATNFSLLHAGLDLGRVCIDKGWSARVIVVSDDLNNAGKNLMPQRTVPQSIRSPETAKTINDLQQLLKTDADTNRTYTVICSLGHGGHGGDGLLKLATTESDKHLGWGASTQAVQREWVMGPRQPNIKQTDFDLHGADTAFAQNYVRYNDMWPAWSHGDEEIRLTAEEFGAMLKPLTRDDTFILLHYCWSLRPTQQGLIQIGGDWTWHDRRTAGTPSTAQVIADSIGHPMHGSWNLAAFRTNYDTGSLDPILLHAAAQYGVYMQDTSAGASAAVKTAVGGTAAKLLDVLPAASKQSAAWKQAVVRQVMGSPPAPSPPPSP